MKKLVSTLNLSRDEWLKYRKQGIGKAMAVFAMKALQKEQINKVSLIAASTRTEAFFNISSINAASTL